MDKLQLTATVTCCLLLFSCNKKQAPPAVPTPVNVVTAEAHPVTYYDRYTATTVALNQVNLLPEVQGYITGIYFRDGSHVTKGEKLYDIDRRIYEANYNSAVANLQVAQGNMKQAQQDADRYEYLNSNKAVAKQLYDHAAIALDNAANEYKSAQQSVKNSQTNLNYSVITAPFDGTIGFSQVKIGDLASVGQTVLNTISTDDPMGVDFLINEKQLSYFKRLHEGTFEPSDSLFRLVLPDNSAYSITGKIYAIDRAVNPQTGSIRMRLVFSNPKNDLRPGMSCIVMVRNQDSAPRIVIPNKAVVEQMGEYFVYVAKDTVLTPAVNKAGGDHPAGETKMMIAQEKKVRTGTVIGPDIIILNGINPGDRIIVDGLQSLHDGAQITLMGRRSSEQRGKNKT
ncbi:MAG: efflux RND transporter periplasmic adaptor subunit [Bacteroidales bacterium]|jgi:membrane fusion protein (multidrug efflux system)